MSEALYKRITDQTKLIIKDTMEVGDQLVARTGLTAIRTPFLLQQLTLEAGIKLLTAMLIREEDISKERPDLRIEKELYQ